MLQSLYTAAVVDHIITARIDAAHRSRSLPRRRRRFLRGERVGAPLSASSGRLSVDGAGR
jgi:hypothetical protein